MISGLKLTFETPGGGGIETLIAAYERAGDELQDFGKYLWPRLTPLLEEHIRSQFDAQGEGTTGPWAPLSAQYAAWKEQNYPGMPILKRTGAMYEGLTESGSPFAFRVASGNDYNFGTRGVEYASYHQTGTDRMEARPPVDFGAGFETELVQAGAAAAREALQQAGIDAAHDLSSLGAA